MQERHCSSLSIIISAKTRRGTSRLHDKDSYLPRHHRVFLSARDRADTPAGSLDFVIGESIAHIVVVTARLFDRRLALRLRQHNVPIGQWPFLLFLWANEDLSHAT